MKRLLFTTLLFCLLFCLQSLGKGNGVTIENNDTILLYSYYNSYDNLNSENYGGTISLGIDFVTGGFDEKYVEITNNDIDTKKEILLHFDNDITLSLKPLKDKVTYSYDPDTGWTWEWRESFLDPLFPYYILLCPCKKHVLYRFPIYDKFQNVRLVDYNFDLIKLKDYANVTTYELIIKYYASRFGEDIEYSEIIWLAKDHDGYCGSLNNNPMPLMVEQITDKDKEYYNYIKDMYIDIINDELNNIKESLDNGKTISWFYIGRYIHYISCFDEELGAELKSRYGDLLNRQNDFYTGKSKTF